jgi:peroxiredoxin
MKDPSESMDTKEKNGRSPFLFLGGAVLIGLAAVLLIFGSGMFRQEESVLKQIPTGSGEATVAQVVSDDSGVLMAGDTAQNFFLQDLQGNTVSLEDFRGRPVVVNFWATWCAPCRLEMPALQDAQDQYEDDGLVILAINDQESVEDVADFVDELDLRLTTLLDPDGVVSGLYNVFNFPTTVFVDADGVVTAVHRGLLVESQIEEYLSQTIPQEG